MVRRIRGAVALALVAAACAARATTAAPPQSTASTGSSTASPMTTTSPMSTLATLATPIPWPAGCARAQPDVATTTPAPAWAAAIATKLADPRLAGNDFSISIWVDGFGEIVSRAPDRLLMPASNQKLWTAAGIQLSLPPDFTFRTQA